MNQNIILFFIFILLIISAIIIILIISRNNQAPKKIIGIPTPSLVNNTTTPYSIINTTTPYSEIKTVNNIVVVDFLVYSEAFENEGKIWWINTATNPTIGDLYLSGSQKGKSSLNGTITYLKSLQTKGIKVICSIGGGGAPLNDMFPSAADAFDFANTFASVLLGSSKAINSQNWKISENFVFDGYDLDIESNTFTSDICVTIVKKLKEFAPDKICMIAPMAPNFFAGFPNGLNGNGSWYPYQNSTINNISGEFNTSSNENSLLHPTQLSLVNYVFVQFYNQGDGWYLGEGGFDNRLAGIAYTILKSKSTCRLIFGLCSGDCVSHTWSENDATLLNTAIFNANDILKNQTEFKSVKIDNWLSGIGFWMSPKANTYVKTIYTNKTIPNLPTNATVLYLNQKSEDPKWIEDLLITN